MVYIWAWQAPPLQPDAWISSRIAAPAPMPEPAAAVALGNQRGQETRVGQRLHELPRVGALAVLLAPVLAGVARAEGADRLAQLAVVVVEVDEGAAFAHSTVTDFARLRG